MPTEKEMRELLNLGSPPATIRAASSTRTTKAAFALLSASTKV
jgi:hypothetical protein